MILETTPPRSSSQTSRVTTGLKHSATSTRIGWQLFVGSIDGNDQNATSYDLILRSNLNKACRICGIVLCSVHVAEQARRSRCAACSACLLFRYCRRGRRPKQFSFITPPDRWPIIPQRPPIGRVGHGQGHPPHPGLGPCGAEQRKERGGGERGAGGGHVCSGGVQRSHDRLARPTSCRTRPRSRSAPPSSDRPIRFGDVGSKGTSATKFLDRMIPRSGPPSEATVGKFMKPL